MKDKREYIQSNKDWLEAKAKEEGVKALPKGIYYKVLSVIRTAQSRRYAASLRLITQVRPSMANSLTAVVAVCRWHADSVT